MAEGSREGAIADIDSGSPSDHSAGRSIIELIVGAKEEVWAAILRGLIVLIGGYLAAIFITPTQLYRMVYLRNADSYVGTWAGQIDGQYAELNINTQYLDDNGKTVRISGNLTWRGNNLPVEGLADSSVTLRADVKNHQLTIALDRTQGDPGTPQEKDVQLLPVKPGQGARLCRRIVDLINPGPPVCTAYEGPTNFSARFS